MAFKTKLSCWLAVVVGVFLISHLNAEAKDLTVFIHGTAAFTPENRLLAAWNDTTLRKANWGPYLGLGLQQVDPDIIKRFNAGEALPESEQAIAAHHILAAYHGLSDEALATQEYFVFGWVGAFAKKTRMNAARDLYHALQEHAAPGDRITLVAHSHGSLALFLPLVVDEEGKALVIERLVLFGAPLSEETARLAYDERVFKQVFNFYSLADRHQRSDYFTLSDRNALSHIWASGGQGSQTTFASFGFPPSVTGHKQVYDVRLSFQGNEKTFDHNQLFCINRQSAFRELWPLPVAVLTPLFLRLFTGGGSGAHTTLDMALTDHELSLNLQEVEGLAQASLKADASKLTALVEASRRNFHGPAYWMKAALGFGAKE